MKKGVSTVFAIGVLVIGLLACGGNAGNDELDKDSLNIAIEKQLSYIEKDKRLGELGLFDLVGPVRECVLITGGDTIKYTFSRMGMWLKENDVHINELFVGGILRDDYGRIIAGKVDETEDLGRFYTYANCGKMASCRFQYALDDFFSQKYLYNDKGDAVLVIGNYTPDFEDENDTGHYEEEITILERDKFGNWTKRERGNNGLDIREITYYDQKDGAPVKIEEPERKTKYLGDMIPRALVHYYIEHSIRVGKGKPQSQQVKEEVAQTMEEEIPKLIGTEMPVKGAPSGIAYSHAIIEDVTYDDGLLKLYLRFVPLSGDTFITIAEKCSKTPVSALLKSNANNKALAVVEINQSKSVVEISCDASKVRHPEDWENFGDIEIIGRTQGTPIINQIHNENKRAGLENQGHIFFN